MQTTLAQMSEEYFDAAKEMDALIEKYTKQLKQAYKSKNYLKTYELKRKIAVFYDQKKDIMITAYTLKNYYNKEDNNELDKAVS